MTENHGRELQRDKQLRSKLMNSLIHGEKRIRFVIVKNSVGQGKLDQRIERGKTVKSVRPRILSLKPS